MKIDDYDLFHQDFEEFVKRGIENLVWEAEQEKGTRKETTITDRSYAPNDAA